MFLSETNRMLILTPCITVNTCIHLSDRFLARDTPIDLNAAINQPQHTTIHVIHEIPRVLLLGESLRFLDRLRRAWCFPSVLSSYPQHSRYLYRENGDERADRNKAQRSVINAPPSSPSKRPIIVHQPDRYYFLLPSPLFPLPQVKVSRAIYRRNEFKDPLQGEGGTRKRWRYRRVTAA